MARTVVAAWPATRWNAFRATIGAGAAGTGAAGRSSPATEDATAPPGSSIGARYQRGAPLRRARARRRPAGDGSARTHQLPARVGEAARVRERPADQRGVVHEPHDHLPGDLVTPD